MKPIILPQPLAPRDPKPTAGLSYTSDVKRVSERLGGHGGGSQGRQRPQRERNNEQAQPEIGEAHKPATNLAMALATLDLEASFGETEARQETTAASEPLTLAELFQTAAGAEGP